MSHFLLALAFVFFARRSCIRTSVANAGDGKLRR